MLKLYRILDSVSPTGENNTLTLTLLHIPSGRKSALILVPTEAKLPQSAFGLRADMGVSISGRQSGSVYLKFMGFAAVLLQSAYLFFVFSANRTAPCNEETHRLSEIIQPVSVARTNKRTNTSSTTAAPTAVFYNLYVKRESDMKRVSQIVQEQFREVDPSYHTVVHVNSIGVPMPSISNFTSAKVIEIGQSPKGSELDTLRSLWEYCKFNPDNNVIYLHSKGSFHPTRANNQLRRFITTGALSRECAELPDTCNVCSSRMSPMPHPHTSGNMWLARCSYVRNHLMEPFLFQEEMGPNKGDCGGAERFSAEHWVHSHPSVRPCDLYTQPDFVWNYGKIPSTERLAQNLHLAQAPRFAHDSYLIPGVCDGAGSLQHRLDEYERIYRTTPDRSWWGWEFFNHSVVA